MSDILEELGFAKPQWMCRGACVGANVDTFFSGRGANEQLRRARAICVSCPVREECLNYALEHGIQHGVWGGTSERERRRMRRELGIVSPMARSVASCGTNAGYGAHRRRGEVACADCLHAAAMYRAKRRAVAS
jgi:WhiB family redox-sensing transcriptional regulator